MKQEILIMALSMSLGALEKAGYVTLAEIEGMETFEEILPLLVKIKKRVAIANAANE